MCSSDLDASGMPQKLGPCGNEAPQTPSNAVTPFQPGERIMIQLNEIVFHPGHYRVALAPTQNDLPSEPAVTATAQDQCALADVAQSPALPILADNQLVHTSPLSGTQTIPVMLPTNPPCTSCVLQVIEFMSSHGAPCFYHHCANITIGSGPSDAGGDSSTSNPGAPPAADRGCSCSVPGRANAPTGLALLACLASAVAARRSRRTRGARLKAPGRSCSCTSSGN